MVGSLLLVEIWRSVTLLSRTALLSRSTFFWVLLRKKFQGALPAAPGCGGRPRRRVDFRTQIVGLKDGGIASSRRDLAIRPAQGSTGAVPATGAPEILKHSYTSFPERGLGFRDAAEDQFFLATSTNNSDADRFFSSRSSDPAVSGFQRRGSGDRVTGNG